MSILYCFEVAVDTIRFSCLPQQIPDKFSLSFKFDDYEWIALCERDSLSSTNLGLIQMFVGKSCYFTATAEQLQSIRSNGFLGLRLSSNDEVFATCKISLQTDSRGWGKLYSNNTIFAEIFLAFRISNPDFVHKAEPIVHTTAIVSSVGAQTHWKRRDSSVQTKEHRHSTAQQTTEPNLKSRRIQTASISLKSRSTSPILAAPSVAQRESEPQAQNIATHDLLPLMNVLLKRFLPLNQVDHFPLLAAISQELDKATLHNDIDNIAGRTRSRSKPTRSAPVERLALGDSRFGFNLFGRMQAAQSLPYKLNKTAAQRIIYQPFYQPKEQGYESGVRMGNSRRLSNDRAYNSQQQQRVMHIKDEQCQVHPEELDDGVNVARPKPIAVQTDDSRMAAAGTQTDYVPRRHSTVVVRRKHDRTLSRGSNARASADHRPRQNSTFLGDMRRSSSAMSALASSQARNAARQRVSLSQSRRQYHGVVTPPPPPPPPLPSVRPGSVARDRRKESLGRRLSSAAISPITAAYSSDFADDSNASADTAARELSVIVSSESQAESESDTTSSVPEEAIPKSSSASSVSTEKAPSSVRSVGTVIEKRKSSSSESSVASEVIERELKKMERASVEQRTQRPLSPTSAYLAKLRAERSRIAPVVKPVSPVNTDSVSSYQPSDVDFLSPRF